MKVAKYQSCQNTFLICLYEKNTNYSEMAIKLCDEEKYNLDGLLVFKNDPIEVLIYNKDGSEANMCGNGLNCIAHYCYDKFRIYNYLKVLTKAGIYECELINIMPFYSSVNLGTSNISNSVKKETIIINDESIEIYLLEMGVLHAVVFVDDFHKVKSSLDEILSSPLIMNKYNIDFVHIDNENSIEVITYEKGVGWTNSCGTGSAASAYVAHKFFNKNKCMNVFTPGGKTRVEINENIKLISESSYVEDYEVNI